MARLNKALKEEPKFTHEGARAARTTPLQDLRRSVMSCMLWEDEFYEDGVSIAERIQGLASKVPPSVVAEVAIEAREKANLRHVPLLLLCELARNKGLMASTVERVIQRPDELAEILAIYQRGRTGTKRLNRLSKQLQKGLAAAFCKFNEYQLAKYNRDGEIKLRDVLFLCHAKPRDEAQAALWRRLIDGELVTPDTWEVALSATKGENKGAEWERLLREDRLGALALLRNLRNMQEARVDLNLVRKALEKTKVDRILPFRFIVAARYAPQLEPDLEACMFRCLKDAPRLSGTTALVVDCSGSMFGARISAKSEMDRFEAAAALAILARETCERVNLYAFHNEAFVIPARRGFALKDALRAVGQGNSYGGKAVAAANNDGYDRIIVLTDGQWHSLAGHYGFRPEDSEPLANRRAYMLNVGSYKNGVGYGRWNSIDGFSESVLDYIRVSEGVGQ